MFITNMKQTSQKQPKSHSTHYQETFYGRESQESKCQIIKGALDNPAGGKIQFLMK